MVTSRQVDGRDNEPQVEGAVGQVHHFLGVNLPDLVESTVGDPPSSAVLGQTFSASETVTNQGIADAGASFTKYYLSTDGVSPLYLLGNRSVGAITAGNTDSGTTMVTVPNEVPEGSYFLVACADSGPGTGGRVSEVAESDETNNCTASAGSVAITGPNLIESNVSATLDVSGTLTVSDTVQNTGSATAGPSITRWWLSTDTIKDANDPFIRNCTNGGPVPGRNVGSINGGQSDAGQSTTSPLCVRDANGLHPPASGTYYVIACADETHVVGELNESNNCATSSNTVQVIGNIDLIESCSRRRSSFDGAPSARCSRSPTRSRISAATLPRRRSRSSTCRRTERRLTFTSTLAAWAP